MEPSAPILNGPATARYIRKVGDKTTISISTEDGGLISVIPEYHYINEGGRHVLKYSTTGTNLSPEVMNQLAAQGGTGMTALTSGEIELSGSNYDAVDRYIMAKFGGARLSDLVPGELPKSNPDTQVGSGYLLNDMLGTPENQELETSGISVTSLRPEGYYGLNENDANLSKFKDVLRDNGVNQEAVDFIMNSKDFYNRLQASGYEPLQGSAGGGISGSLKGPRTRLARFFGVETGEDKNVQLAVDVALQLLRENGMINE